MSNHITINGRTFASVEEMPLEIRRQYESAMQMLARNTGAAVSAAESDVNISTQDRGPAHLVSRVAVQRFMVNGKECHDWNDLPAEARAAFQDAARGASAPAPIAGNSQPPNTIRTPAYRPLHDPSLDTRTGITINLPTLAVFLLLAVLAGVFIGWKFLH